MPGWAGAGRLCWQHQGRPLHFLLIHAALCSASLPRSWRIVPRPAIPCPAADGPDGPRWEMVGLVPLFDPPRHDTKETIERCHVVSAVCRGVCNM